MKDFPNHTMSRRKVASRDLPFHRKVTEIESFDTFKPKLPARTFWTIVASFLLVLFLAGCSIDEQPPTSKIDDIINTKISEAKRDLDGLSASSIDEFDNSPGQTSVKSVLNVQSVDWAAPPRLQQIAVEGVWVVDGDTIAFNDPLSGEQRKVRLLLLDTPESVKQGTSPMPYGKEASNYVADLVSTGETVTLMFDNGDIRDKYDRYLAYVFVDGESIQEKVLANGFGIVRYVNPGNNTYVDSFLLSQRAAENKKTGVWSLEGYVYQDSTGYYNYAGEY